MRARTHGATGVGVGGGEGQEREGVGADFHKKSLWNIHMSYLRLMGIFQTLFWMQLQQYL